LDGNKIQFTPGENIMKHTSLYLCSYSRLPTEKFVSKTLEVTSTFINKIMLIN